MILPPKPGIDVNTIDLPSLETKIKSLMHENGHAIISPSSASIWMNCIGAGVGLNEYRAIALDNVASVEGTCAHTLLELSLLNLVSPLYISHQGSGETGVVPSDEFLDDTEKWFQRIVTNSKNEEQVIEKAVECREWIVNVQYPPDMRMEVAKTYDIIMEYVNDGWSMIPEIKVHLSAFLGHGQCDGTSDIILYKGTEMMVVDLKYGISIEVHPEHNRQLKIYAGGAVSYVHALTGNVIENITLVISQSRINDGVWKDWFITYSDLYNWLIEEVRPASIRALYAIANQEESVEDWYKPSLSACQWCHRKRTCRPRFKMALEEVKKAFMTVNAIEGDDLKPKPFDPDTVTDKELADVLDNLPFISGWFKDAEAEALVRTKRGFDIGGRKMVQGRLRNAWVSKEKDMIKKFISMGITPDQIWGMKLKSPAQMRASAIDPEIKKEVEKLIVSTRGEDVLALAEDSRGKITKLMKVQNEFAKIIK